MSPPGSPLVPPRCGWYMPMTLGGSRPMRLASCDLWTHFAPVQSPPRPPYRAWQAGAPREAREPGKPELRGSQSVYSVSWFDWIPCLENANCHIGFLDFPILKHEQMLNSAQL